MATTDTSSPTATQTSIWQTFICIENQVYQWQSGTLQILIKRLKNDWIFSEKITGDIEDVSGWQLLDQEPEAIEWVRWALSECDGQLEILPVMPDRPLVVKTRISSHLLSGETTCFFVSIPVWTKFSALKKKVSIELNRFKSVTLSNTWFGDHFEGELCYAIKTRAARELSDIPKRPSRAICKVTIHNKSETPLPIQKICVRAKHLSIYNSNGQLWTNNVHVTFRGADLTSRVEYMDTIPDESEEPRLLLKAEEKPGNNFISSIGSSILDIL